MSVDNAGQTQGGAEFPSMSGDGRIVTFGSAGAFVPWDTNMRGDVYARDVTAQTTTLVSLSNTGALGDEGCAVSSVSADAHFIAFESLAANLVPGDTNSFLDIFVRDTQVGSTTRLSVSSLGVEANSYSSYPSISGDGRFVAYISGASNLVPPDMNLLQDAFLSDGLLNPFVAYCTAKTNSLGCIPAIDALGMPVAGAFSGFNVRAQNVRNNKVGLLFYGLAGQWAFPFQGGFLCVKPPIERTPAVQSAGNSAPAQDCSGVYSIDFSAFASGALGGNPQPALNVPGTQVNCQWWGRDPGYPSPGNTSLSGGLEFIVQP